MRGFALDFEPAYGQHPEHDTHVIGLIVQKTVPDVDAVRAAVAKGAEMHSGAIWVVAETDKVAREILAGLGVEPLLLPLNPFHKKNGYDLRGITREQEMLWGCDELVVFQREGSKTRWNDRAAEKREHGIHANLFLVELGAPKANRRKKRRAPVSV